MDIDAIKRDIVVSLHPLNPEKVILFGSYAHGTPADDSDIDLYIVSKENFIPRTYSENMRHYKKYTRVLKHLKEKVPVDIIVHTLEMNRIFEMSDSSFVKEITAKGVRLI
jgi:predicted nucleotidyltransferase